MVISFVKKLAMLCIIVVVLLHLVKTEEMASISLNENSVDNDKTRLDLDQSSRQRFPFRPFTAVYNLVFNPVFPILVGK